MPDPVLSTGESPEAVPAAQEAKPRPRRAKMFDDPLVTTMAFIAAGLVVLYLAAVAGAVFFGILGNAAPRTAAERDLDAAQSAVRAGDHSAKTFAKYVNALIDVGQYGKAQDVIDSAPNTARGTLSGDLELAQATLYYARKDYSKAISAGDIALKVIKTNYEKELKKPDLNASKSYGIDANYDSALLIKAMSQQALGDAKAALASFDEYLAQNPMESNVLVNRGQVKLQLKDETGAKTDFRTALKYDPGNQRATDELKKIGAK